MLNKRSFSAVKWPALVLFLLTFLGLSLSDPLTGSESSYYVLVWFFSSVFCCLIFELFSYITCWALVLRKGKGDRAVWINYIIWILIVNLDSINRLLQ